MNRWFHLTLVCCVLLCLFLSLPQAVGLNHGLQIVGLRSYFDRGAESASDAPTVSVVRRMRFDPAHASISDPRRRVDREQSCSTRLGDSCANGTDRPGRVAGQRSRRQRQPTLPAPLFSPNLLAQATNFQESVFHNSL
jgi:hypothetical protein